MTISLYLLPLQYFHRLNPHLYLSYCVAFSSGSAATSAVTHLLNHGDNILCIDDVYGGTQRYFRKIVNPSMNICVDFVDFDNEEETQAKLTPRTKLLWLESPTNPTLKVRTDSTFS